MRFWYSKDINHLPYLASHHSLLALSKHSSEGNVAVPWIAKLGQRNTIVEAWKYRGAAYKKRRSHTSSDVTDMQRSHHIKAHSEALSIRSSTDVFFVAGRMSRLRRPYLARTTTLHTRRQRRRYVMTAGNG